MTEPLPNKAKKRLNNRKVNGCRASAAAAAAVTAGAGAAAAAAAAGAGSAVAAAEALVDAAPAVAAAVALTATATTAAAAGCSPDPAAASALCTVGDGELALGLLSPLKLEVKRAPRLMLDVAATELAADGSEGRGFAGGRAKPYLRQRRRLSHGGSRSSMQANVAGPNFRGRRRR